MESVTSHTAESINNDVMCLVNVALKRRSLYLSLKGVCEKLSFSESAIKKWVKNKTFPQPVIIYKHPRWVESEVDTWIEQQNPERLGVRHQATQLEKDGADILAQL